MLHEASKEPVETCLSYLQQYMLQAYAVTDTGAAGAVRSERI